ncbi:MAG: YebC/PmpR family DNA-binding transcriptional regulator [Candidatus Peribacteraceae bacterium]|nr:YebC/PmpR family DNA-binding transcriptional regulator [Candidatus Peribacteraceae bacterium]
MSGHSKWSTIKRAKGAADAKRGQIFTRHAKNIELAAREGGGDPDMNAALASAIENSKADNFPKENIERAIKKGTGELEGQQIEEKIYEGYAPGGVALLIRALTDNPNRTVANVRHILTKNGGKVAESGSVAFQFEKKGVITLADSSEATELAAIEAGAADLEKAGQFLLVKTEATKLMEVRKNLADQNLKIESAELVFEPVNEIKIEDTETARKILNLVEALEEDEDIDSVSANFDIDEELVKS